MPTGGHHATAAPVIGEDTEKKILAIQCLNLLLRRPAHIRLIKLIGR